MDYNNQNIKMCFPFVLDSDLFKNNDNETKISDYQKQWEGTPENLRDQAEKIINNKKISIDNKVMELRNLSFVFFYNAQIAQVLKISINRVNYILKKNEYNIYKIRIGNKTKN